MRDSTAKVLRFRPRRGRGGHTAPDLGSRELVLEWFERHRAPLLRYARRVLPARESAEDLVQDVFCRLLDHPDLASLNNPQAFLMASARNAAIDRLRKLRPQADVADLDLRPAGGAPLDETELASAIGSALESLPDRCREVFVLRRFKGMDTAAVARRMGISKRMVQKHVAAALAHFDAHLRAPD
ncbi:RNA polymerase sigma factor [Elongatibacter sediminis]|uniref:Sigma-70 family RNA polymerase sigma factor n=1 Tax=Elongatibacter sediminis TaxID=3119006 RepID=A0AAW9RGL4_9GAMM